ncbi:MAG: hypothetical protein ACLR23_17910 [Clostridia bacterium]
MRARQEISSWKRISRDKPCSGDPNYKSWRPDCTSNEVEESIACFSVDEDGKLWKQQSASAHGKHPHAIVA